MFAPKLINKFLYVLIASLIVVGCDSSDDDDGGGDTPAAELFQGSWEVVSAADMGGSRDQTAVIADRGVLSIGFDDAEMYTLAFDFVDEAEEDLGVDGVYAISESNMSVTLTVSLNGLSVPLGFNYRFIDDDRVELTTVEASIAATIGLLLGASLEGNAVLVLDRVG
ncbi:MAG: hypothetical protein KTR29_10535 [Rhodothermaceae bacterium]|nr:hypothetical protein [Rhodothermaceae bacterium]